MGKKKEKLIIGGAVILLGLMAFFGFYKCPFRFITGIPCPGCGMTRAFRELVKGNIRRAFYYHPLWPMALGAAILLVLYFFDIIKPSWKIIEITAVLAATALIICYLVRIITGTLFVS